MSRYLEAKRKLLFAIATVKYIRLVMTNNKLITKDEVEAFTREALAMKSKENSVSEDKADLDLVHSIVAFSIREHIDSSASLTMDVKPKAYIEFNEEIKIPSFVELGNAKSKAISITDNLEVLEKVNLTDIEPNALSSVLHFQSLNMAEFKAIETTLIKICESMIAEYQIPLKAIETCLIGAESITCSNSSLNLDASHFITIPIHIEDIYYVYDNTMISYGNSDILSGKELSNIYNNVEVLAGESVNLKSVQLINIKDFLRLRIYKYTLLKDIKNLDIDIYYDTSISETIYTEV